MRLHEACVVSVFREEQSPETVDATFQNISHPGLHIAPGEGLYLDEVCKAHFGHKNPNREDSEARLTVETSSVCLRVTIWVSSLPMSLSLLIQSAPKLTIS